jgi:hypothetical protein
VVVEPPSIWIFPRRDGGGGVHEFFLGKIKKYKLYIYINLYIYIYIYIYIYKGGMGEGSRSMKYVGSKGLQGHN